MKEEKNKKIAKIVLVSVISIAVLFTFVRIFNLNNEDKIIVAPQIEDKNRPDVVLPKEQSKLTQMASEKTQVETNGNEDYVYQNFKNMYVPPSGQAQTSNVPTSQTTNSIVQTQSNVPVQTNSYSSAPEYNSEYEMLKILEKKRALEAQQAQSYIPQANTTVAPVEVQQTVPIKNSYFGKRKDNTSVNREDRSGGDSFFKAEIYGSQKIPNGGAATFRNLQDIKTEDVVIPKNSVLYGKANYTGERVKIDITRAKTIKGDFNIHLSVCDGDYIDGIFFKSNVDKAIESSGGEVVDNALTKINPLAGAASSTIRNISNGARQDKKLALDDGYAVFLKTN